MKSFWSMVNKVIHDSDVILMILDARMIKETRHNEIEDKVKRSGKPFIYTINKSDLADRRKIESYKYRLKPSVFISSKTKQGLSDLRELIHIIASKHKIKDTINVGVLGYPNVGKSSIINALKGHKSAPTSAMSGYTKGIQKVKTSSKIMMLDTPGVIPYMENDTSKHSKIGTIDYTKDKDPESTVNELMVEFPGMIEKHYDVPTGEDKDETIEQIAMKKNILKQGGKADAKRMARMILTAWQKGNIKN